MMKKPYVKYSQGCNECKQGGFLLYHPPPPKKKTKPVFVGEIRSRLTKVHTVQVQMTQKRTDDRTD